MKFCIQCSNMLYLRIDDADSNQLTYYCRNCGHVDDTVANDGACILTTRVKQSEQKFGHVLNKYTKHDPTLPRIYSLRCPNDQCTTNVVSSDSYKRPDTEVLYIRYDDDNLKYVYMCVACDTTWKTNDK